MTQPEKPPTLTLTAKEGEETREIRLKGWLFQPEVWGGDVWRTFHGILFKYPNEPTPEDKMRWLSFILNLPYFLPCGECSLNLVAELKALPPTDEVFKNTTTLAQWGTELHNSVNKRLNKPLVTFKDVVDFYYFDAQRDPRKINVEEYPSPFQSVVDSINNPVSTLQLVILIILFIVCIYIIYRLLRPVPYRRK